MTPLGPGEIRARRRPFVVLGIALLRLGCGLVLAFPLASLVAESGVGLRADGDRVLFEGGGYLLLEVLRLQGPSLIATARGLVPLLGVALLLTAACNAALFVALNVRGRLQLGAWLGRAFERLPGLVVIGVGASLTQLLLFGLGSMLTGALPDSMARPVQASALQVGAWLLLAALLGAVGGLSDVAKACFVRNEGGVTTALRQALICSIHHPWRACLGWSPYGLAFVASVWLSSELVSALDVSRSGALRVLAVWAVHQLVVVASVALRAAWFARALRLSAVAGV